MSYFLKLIGRISAKYHASIKEEIDNKLSQLKMAHSQYQQYQLIWNIAYKYNQYNASVNNPDIQVLASFVLQKGIGGVQCNIDHWANAMRENINWLKDRGVTIPEEYSTFN